MNTFTKSRKASNRREPGHDWIHVIWFKKFWFIHVNAYGWQEYWNWWEKRKLPYSISSQTGQHTNNTVIFRYYSLLNFAPLNICYNIYIYIYICISPTVGGWWGQGIARAFIRCMIKKYIYVNRERKKKVQFLCRLMKYYFGTEVLQFSF